METLNVISLGLNVGVLSQKYDKSSSATLTTLSDAFDVYESVLAGFARSSSVMPDDCLLLSSKNPRPDDNVLSPAEPPASGMSGSTLNRVPKFAGKLVGTT